MQVFTVGLANIVNEERFENPSPVVSLSLVGRVMHMGFSGNLLLPCIVLVPCSIVQVQLPRQLHKVRMFSFAAPIVVS